MEEKGCFQCLEACVSKFMGPNLPELSAIHSIVGRALKPDGGYVDGDSHGVRPAVDISAVGAGGVPQAVRKLATFTPKVALLSTPPPEVLFLPLLPQAY